MTVKTAEEWDEITEKLKMEFARQRKIKEHKRMSNEEVAAYIIDRQDKYGGMIVVNRKDAMNEMLETIKELNLRWN